MKANSPELKDIPHEYMSSRTWLTASMLMTRSPVMGQVPWLAREAATTALLLQVISREDSWKKKKSKFSLVEIERVQVGSIWGHKPDLEVKVQDLFEVRSGREAGVLPEEVGQGKVPVGRALLRQEHRVVELHHLASGQFLQLETKLSKQGRRPLSSTMGSLLVSADPLNRPLTWKMLKTYSYFRAKSSSSGCTNWTRSEADTKAPEFIRGLNGLSVASDASIENLSTDCYTEDDQ